MSFGGWNSETPEEKVGNDVWWDRMKLISDMNKIVFAVAAGNEDQAIGVPAPYDDFRSDSNGNPLNEYKKGDYCYPASFIGIDNMIVVAAADYELRRSVKNAGSNYSGTYVDITAPGGLIVSTTPTWYVPDPNKAVAKGYALKSGTSMAAPHVAGAAALLKSAYPNATAAEIKRALLVGANGKYCKSDKDSVTYNDGHEHTKDNTSAHGFLDVKGALDYLDLHSKDIPMALVNY